MYVGADGSTRQLGTNGASFTPQGAEARTDNAPVMREDGWTESAAGWLCINAAKRKGGGHGGMAAGATGRKHAAARDGRRTLYPARRGGTGRQPHQSYARTGGVIPLRAG